MVRRSQSFAPAAVIVSALLYMLATSSVAHAGTTVRYVGVGATCNQLTDHPSLAAALFAAAVSPGPDEIRLTATLAYSNFDVPDLVDWHPAAAGTLTIAGGYSDCDDSTASGRTTISGQPGEDLIVVRTSSQPTSIVTLRNLELTQAGSRGARVLAGADLVLDNVAVANNAAGISVQGDAGLTVTAASSISDNGGNVTQGGGIRCIGSSANVWLSGDLERNVATLEGGNLWVGGGCLVEIFAGVTIRGPGAFPGPDAAPFGAGVYVENAQLISYGGPALVTIRDHHAGSDGGAFFVTGASAVVELNNTNILYNSARLSGAAAHVENGATFTMRRVDNCGLIYSCSRIGLNNLEGGTNGEAIFASNATVELQRSILDRNGTRVVSSFPGFGDGYSLIEAQAGTVLRLDSVALTLNNVVDLLRAKGGSQIEAAFVSSARNSYMIDSLPAKPWTSVADASTASFHGSILVDSKGFQSPNGGITSANCLLVDSGIGLPPGTFFVGIPEFLDPDQADLRQHPSSPGVDMCPQSSPEFADFIDVSMNPRGLDLAVNPNGFPGVLGGTFDAGFYEVQGEEAPTPVFADGFESGNTSAWE